jgi:hypothetical protein
MNPKRDDRLLSRLELLVLARHSADKPPGPSTLVKDLHKRAMPEEPESQAKEKILAAAAMLQQRGLLTKPARTSRTLTEAGGSTLRSSFQLGRTPSWVEVINNHLPAQTLGARPGTEEANMLVKDGARLSAGILRDHLKLEKGATLSAIANDLLLQALGTSGPVTLKHLRLLVLARKLLTEQEKPDDYARKLAGDSKVSFEDAARRLVAKLHKLPNTKKTTLVPVLCRRWVAFGQVHEIEPVQAAQVSLPVANNGGSNGTHHSNGNGNGNGASAKPPQPPQPPVSSSAPPPAPPRQPPSPEVLLKTVKELIPHVGADGRHGSEKVFVSALWKGISSDQRIEQLPLDKFKSWLLTANRKGELILARADFPAAMNPKLVAESEIQDQGSTFHFVLDRANAERRNHAR